MDTIEATPEILDEETMKRATDRKVLARARRLAGRVPFARHVAALWYAMKDDATPMSAKGTILGALAYFMMPIDLVPDVIVALGFTDDAAVIALALQTVAGHVKSRHYEAADDALA